MKKVILEKNLMDLLKRHLLREEGYRRSAYQDSLGYWTIGIGRLIDGKKGGGVTIEEAFYLLDNEVKAKRAIIEAALPWFSALDEVRQCVLVSMAYQLGTTGLFGFHTTLRAVAEGRFSDAAESMLKSRWAAQTPSRALRMSDAMRTGAVESFKLDPEAPADA